MPELITDSAQLQQLYLENVALVLGGHELAHGSEVAERFRAALIARFGEGALSHQIEEALVAYPATAVYARKINPNRFARMIDDIESMYQGLFAGAQPDQLRQFAQLFGIETLINRLDSRVLVVGDLAQTRLGLNQAGSDLPDSFRAVSADALAQTIDRLSEAILPDNILVVVHGDDKDVEKVQYQVAKSKLKGKIRVVVDNSNFEDKRFRKVAVAGLELASIIGLEQLMKDTGGKTMISLTAMLDMIPVLGMLARALAEAAVKTSA
jgi:hypothetical protein